jgi:hypothetical protein
VEGLFVLNQDFVLKSIAHPPSFVYGKTVPGHFWLPIQRVPPISPCQ